MTKIQYLTKPEEVSMADQWFDIATVEHFWVKWRYEFFKRFLGEENLKDKNFFEIGCGHGLVINQIEKEFNTVVNGCDLNDYALKKINGNQGDIYCYNIYQKNSEFENHHDGIILFDVIEHIDDDVDFLKTSIYHLKDDGLIMINVPAFNSFFSKYDTEVGHKRRYTRQMLQERLEAVGITDIKTSYWGISLVPVLLARKMFLALKGNNIANDGFKPPSNAINSMFKGMMSLELGLFKQPFVGTSVMAIGRKKKS